MEKLESTEFKNMPLLVNFLIQSTPKGEAAKTLVQNLRQHIQFSESVDRDLSQDDGQSHGLGAGPADGHLGGGRASYDAMTLDALRTGLRQREELVTAFIEDFYSAAFSDEAPMLPRETLLFLKEVNAETKG